MEDGVPHVYGLAVDRCPPRAAASNSPIIEQKVYFKLSDAEMTTSLFLARCTMSCYLVTHQAGQSFFETGNRRYEEPIQAGNEGRPSVQGVAQVAHAPSSARYKPS